MNGNLRYTYVKSLYPNSDNRSIQIPSALHLPSILTHVDRDHQGQLQLGMTVGSVQLQVLYSVHCTVSTCLLYTSDAADE